MSRGAYAWGNAVASMAAFAAGFTLGWYYGWGWVLVCAVVALFVWGLTLIFLDDTGQEKKPPKPPEPPDTPKWPWRFS